MEFRELKELSCLSLCNWCLTLYNEPAFIWFLWGFYERKNIKSQRKRNFCFTLPCLHYLPFVPSPISGPGKPFSAGEASGGTPPVLVGPWPPSAFVCCPQASLTHLALSTAEAYHEAALSLGHCAGAALQVAALLCGDERGSLLPLQLFLLAAPNLWLFPCIPFSEKHTGPVV